MTQHRNRQIRLVKRPNGIPQVEHFALAEDVVGSPAEGEILVKNLHLSVDPAQRGWANDEGNYSDPVPLNSPMRALAAGEIIESRTEGFAPGDRVYGWFGWQEFCLTRPAAILRRIVEKNLPLTASLGALGINGLTAYLALHKLGMPRPGETVLVSTAAGSVGSFVGQLARNAGCTVIGVTGSPDKVDRAVARYGYSAAIDYRHETDIAAAIGQLCPNGIDIFFDNTGGMIADAARNFMRTHGRIIQCGTASVPNWTPVPTGPRVERQILTKRLRWSGFVIFDHVAEFSEAAAVLARLIEDGKLVYDEDIVRGLENAPETLAGLYKGENTGKAIVSLV